MLAPLDIAVVEMRWYEEADGAPEVERKVKLRRYSGMLQDVVDELRGMPHGLAMHAFDPEEPYLIIFSSHPWEAGSDEGFYQARHYVLATVRKGFRPRREAIFEALLAHSLLLEESAHERGEDMPARWRARWRQ